MIYFIQDSATLNIKIGFTAGEAGARQAALQTGNPSPLVLLKTEPGDQQDERRLHHRFAAHRVAGEWFRPAPELLLVVAHAGGDEAARRSRDIDAGVWWLGRVLCRTNYHDGIASITMADNADDHGVPPDLYDLIRCALHAGQSGVFLERGDEALAAEALSRAGGTQAAARVRALFAKEAPPCS